VPDEETAAQVPQIVAAAAGALGRPLGDPVMLQGGSDRSVVLRCRDQARAGTVIVKTYPQTAEGISSIAAEAAGLTLAGGSGVAPELLAADPGQFLVVMSDLGTSGSMADLLLGDSAERASSALLSWAEACGELSAATCGRRAEFDAWRARYSGGRPDESYLAGLGGRILGAGKRAVDLGVVDVVDIAGVGSAGLDALDAEVAEVADLTELPDVAQPGRSADYAVFSPGDICPDNNIVTPAGIRFLDFESAGFHSVFLDAAYIRMPFSTCWCVFRLPAGLTAAAESAYRRQVCAAWPQLADDAVWQPGVRRAMAAWTLSSMWWLLSQSVEADEPTNPDATSPGARQLIRYRWQALAGELESAGEMPALSRLMRSLLAATENWRAPELPLYPAFR